jgi:hypothetical protein
MAETTQTVDATATPTAYGWCAWHKKYSGGVRLIEVIEQGSGPGTAGNLFACGPCREIHRLTPYSDRP